MRSISGCSGRFRASSSSAMRTMPSSTAGARSRPGRCWTRSVVGSQQCGLELHPTKTRIVYCKDDDRPGEYEHVAFDFLGYTFQPRRAKNRWGKFFVSFLPAISAKAAKAIRHTIREWRMASTRNNQRLEDLARLVEPGGAGLDELLRAVLPVEVRSGAPPSQRGPGRMGATEVQAVSSVGSARRMHWLGRIARRDPKLFVLWQLGVRPEAGGRSRMRRESHVRFCEGGGVRFPSGLRLLRR